MKTLFSRFRAQAAAFRAARDGNIAIIFALSAFPIIGLVGASIDYSRANMVKADLQSALDATALMVSKTAATQTSDQLQASALSYFNALFNRPEASGTVISASYTTTGGSAVTVTGSTSVQPQFIGIIPGLQHPLSVNTSSTVNWGNTRLRVALVLDNTGSMSDDGKIAALKTATNGLLTQLRAAAVNNGDVYVSIIPFVKDVNVGTSNYSANWIDWADWEDEPPYIKTNKPSGWSQVNAGDSCPFSTSNHGFGCAPNPTSTSTTSTIPSTGTYAGYICPGTDDGSKVAAKAGSYYNGCYNSVQATNTVSSGWSASCGSTSNCSCSGSGSSKVCTQTYYNHTWIKNAHSTWNGCITDRGNYSAPSSGDYDTNVTAPNTNVTATLYPAEQYGSCPQAVMSLNYNWTAMTSLVSAMSPNGNTNQGIGLQLGWMSLVGGGPFPSAPAKDPNYQYSEVIILLTDGLNTQNRWYTSASSIDTRQATTCTNIKNSGVTIYAVQVNTGGDPTQSVLQNCASSTDKFFLLTTANQMVATFNQIGTNLSNLRVAR